MASRTADVEGKVSFVFDKESLAELLAEREGPCVSIYMPSHANSAEARSDGILYRNLCRAVEKILERDSTPAIVKEIGEKLHALDQSEFWLHGGAGLAVFASPGFFAAYRVPGEFPQLEVVGGSFHTKPMIRYLQNGSGFFVVALTLHGVTVYQGWRERIQVLPIRGLPESVDDWAVDSGAPPRGDGGHHLGRGEASDGQADIERFFREVGKALSRSVVGESGRPVILAAQKHHQSTFRKVASVPGLLEEGIPFSGQSLSVDAISNAAVEILQPVFDRRLEEAREEFLVAKSRQLGSSSLTGIARAAAEGRVKRLCVESGRRFWGLLDRANGAILPGDEHKNAYDVDVYDELAEMTIGQGGEVLVLPGEAMPVKTGIAATYRY